MAEEIINDDMSSHSIDYMSQRQNKNLEIILEERTSIKNNKDDKEDIENKTQFNFNKIPKPLVDFEQPKRSNSCEKRKKNKILEKKMKEIMDYRKKFQSLEMEEKLEEEEIKKEESDKKKKVEKKVNRNLKLLNMIKEKMNMDEIKDENEMGQKDKDNNKIKYKKDEINIEKDNKDENNDKRINNLEEEKKKDEEKENNLLKIFDKKINNEEKNNIKIEDNERNQIKEKEQENEIKDEKEKNIGIYNKYQKNKIPHQNVGSLSYPTFMKKGTGNFHINTPKSKMQVKKNISITNPNKNELDKDSNIKNDNNNKENKFSEVPIEQKNKLTIKISQNKILDTPDKSNQNSFQDSNIKEKKDPENKATSLSGGKKEKKNSNKEGAMKILELLKAKKKEENKNEKNNKNEEEEDTQRIIDNKNIEEINSPNLFNSEKKEEKNIIKNKKHNGEVIYDTRSLPKKKFREEDEDNNFEASGKYNKTTYVFKKSNRKINPNENYNVNSNNNRSSRIKTNYFNNINNNINNYFNLGNAQNIPERKTIDYINNANLIKNKINKKIKGFNPSNQFLNDEDNDNIFEVNNNSHLNYIRKKNSLINTNILNKNNLDNSYDIFQTRKSPIPRRKINTNIISNINNINKIPNSNNSKKITLNQPYEKNTAKNFERNGRIYNKLSYKRKSPTYIKKSPGKITPLNSIENTHKQKILAFNKYNKTNINKNNNNIGNNEDIEISTINKLNSSLDTSISIKTNNKNNKLPINQKQNTMLFNLEDLLILEERLNNITFSLESNKNVERQCFNFWNYYFNCSLYKILEKIFPNEEDANTIRLSINYELMSIMVCYDFAFGNNVEDEDLNLSLIELIYFNHNNLMIISEYILNKITQENTDNIWVLKLQEIVKNSRVTQSKEINNISPIQKISNNTNKIIKKIKSILLNYQSDSSFLLKNYILNLPNKSYSEINSFFRSQILRIANNEGSIVSPSFFKNNQNFIPIPAPYLQFPSSKPFTLILDLDETLVSFQVKSKKEGTLRARPFLFAFLEEMGHYYELIIWTSATEAYANSLIDAIEYDKQYFDFILFREHSIIVGDEFVKDLTRVGRGLDRIIIVDDMPQNFRLQKQNGITIKPFFGDDYNDTALYDLLPILKRIAEEGNDVRIELAKYRNEIIKKITSNISFNDI